MNQSGKVDFYWFIIAIPVGEAQLEKHDVYINAPDFIQILSESYDSWWIVW